MLASSQLGQRPDWSDDETEFIVATQGGWEEAGDEGRAGAGAGDVLTALRVRGIVVTDEAGQRIQSQEDPVIMESWLEKAVLATSIGDVIDDPS